MKAQVIAYYYSGYHACPPLYPALPNTWSEWELLRRARPFFDGHYQPRKPLWGFEDESLPAVMQRKLATAFRYGVNSFCFFNYWYGGREFCSAPLVTALDVATNDSARPCLMWAVHNRYPAFPETGDREPQPYLLVDCSSASLRAIVNRWVNAYLSHPNYFRLPDGTLFVGIYAPHRVGANGNLLVDFVNLLRKSASQSGLPPIHLHACEVRFCQDLSLLGVFDSCSDYLSLGYRETPAEAPALPMLRGELLVNISDAHRAASIRRVFEHFSRVCPAAYFPVVTLGRDCSPRVERMTDLRLGHYSTRPILESFSPSHTETMCEIARSFIKKQKYANPLVMVNAWNEWTEGAYLEPDEKFGFGMLETIQKSL